MYLFIYKYIHVYRTVYIASVSIQVYEISILNKLDIQGIARFSNVCLYTFHIFWSFIYDFVDQKLEDNDDKSNEKNEKSAKLWSSGSMCWDLLTNLQYINI